MALRTPLSVTPHLYMGDSTGRPLDMGTVYFGEQDKDPEFYPIELFSDDALTLPLAQPVHTKGGYLYDKGDMVEPHANELIYSVKVLDSYGRKVFYKGAMMRNSWNDDVIEQINAAIVGSADVARQVATDITNEAIEGVAIDANLVTDALVKTVAPSGGLARNQAVINEQVATTVKYADLTTALEHSTYLEGSVSNQIDISDRIWIPSADATLIGKNTTINQSSETTSSLSATSKNRVAVSGFKFNQPKNTPISGGTDNNHFNLGIGGSRFTRVSFNTFTGQYGVSLGYGPINMPDGDRRNLYSLVLGNNFDGLQGMGIQNIGGSNTAIVGNFLDSKDSRGINSKAAFHGIRLSGYDRRDTNSGFGHDGTDMRCIGVVASSNVIKGYANAISAQNAASLWSISDLYAEDCDRLVYYTPNGDTDLVQAPRLGRITAIGKNVIAPVVGNTYHHCTHDLILDASELTTNEVTGGYYIDELLPVGDGVTGGDRNTYTIYNPPSGGLMMRRKNSTYDLIISKAKSAALQLAQGADNNRVTANITDTVATSAVIVRSNNNNLDLKILGTTGDYALQVLGNNNIVHINTDSNINVTGSGNIIKGRVSGTVTNLGDNDLSGIKGFSLGGFLSTSTDPAGELSLVVPAHPSASAGALVTQLESFNKNYNIRIKQRVGTTYKLVVFDSSGAVVANEALNIRWIYRA